MDKKLILAVAGSGKTTDLIDHLMSDQKVLIITYTNANTSNIYNQVLNKFNCIPEKFRIYSFFEFLYQFCFQPFIKKDDIRGYDFERNQNPYLKDNNINYYENVNAKKMYSNRLSKFCYKNFFNKIIDRIEKYFDYFYIDEVQDFAAHDFNFLFNLIQKINITSYLYGDFYQHTFDTSKDGNTNKNLYFNYLKYKKKVNEIAPSVSIDETSLLKSKRCPFEICNYIKDNLEINMESFSENHTDYPKLIEDEDEIDSIINDKSFVKLFYSEHYKYNIFNTNNWGNSKGLTYENVCVVLNNSTFNNFINKNLKKLKSQTKNKFYVACTRASKKLVFIEEKKISKYKKMIRS